MDALPNANRCLPLSIANSYGWELLAPASFSVHWNGGPGTDDIRIHTHGDDPIEGFAQSNFAGGIVTFHTGYIFRTDPGWNLMVTGPLNEPKDGVSPLSGVVETDWLPYPFTMNWQFTRPGIVRFEKDEPFCRILPVVGKAIEDVRPEIHLLESDLELAGQFREWRERRDMFRVNVRSGHQPTIRERWQKYYFKGELADGQGAAVPHHVQKLRLAEPIDLRPKTPAASRAPEPSVNVADLPCSEGMIPVAGGRIWYRTFGAVGDTPLLIVNGGPGLSHDYLDGLAALANERQVVLFDQLGCGRSDRPTDEGLWSVGKLVDDIGQVRRALGLDRVHLLGHSTGALLAVEHALNEPAGVASLTLASPCLSMPRTMSDFDRLRDQFPADFQMIFARAQSDPSINGANHQAAVRTYYRRHFCRLQPWPESLVRAFTGMGGHMNAALWGPRPLACTGTLRTYEIGGRLADLDVPTLFTCGRHDFATPEATGDFQQQVAHAQLAVFEHSSHTPHLEEPGAYLSTLRAFLVESESQSIVAEGVASIGD